MASGEWLVMFCTVSSEGRFYYIYYDGSNKFYTGYNTTTGAASVGTNLF